MPNADPRVAIPDTDRQYHIDLGPGELAEYILLPGDPDRTDRIAPLLENIEFQRHHREFNSVTGTYKGLRVSVVSTGIGTDNVEIVMAEILALVKQPTLIRIGSCGVLRPEINLGDLVITSGAVRLERTTAYFVHDGYPAVAHYTAVAALVEAAARLNQPAHVGITATAPGFYGAQGRPIPQLPIRYPDLAEQMAAEGVLNFEMEASALLVLAGLAGAVQASSARPSPSGRRALSCRGNRRSAPNGRASTSAWRRCASWPTWTCGSRAAGAVHWRPSLWPAGVAP